MENFDYFFVNQMNPCLLSETRDSAKSVFRIAHLRCERGTVRRPPLTPSRWCRLTPATFVESDGGYLHYRKDIHYLNIFTIV